MIGIACIAAGIAIAVCALLGCACWMVAGIVTDECEGEETGK